MRGTLLHCRIHLSITVLKLARLYLAKFEGFTALLLKLMRSELLRCVLGCLVGQHFQRSSADKLQGHAVQGLPEDRGTTVF